MNTQKGQNEPQILKICKIPDAFEVNEKENSTVIPVKTNNDVAAPQKTNSIE